MMAGGMLRISPPPWRRLLYTCAVSSYRIPPKHIDPIVIRAKRSWITAVFLFGFLAFGLVITGAIFTRVTLTCSRPSDACDFVIVRGPGLFRTTRSIPLASLKRAYVDSYVDSEGDRLSGIALDVIGETVVPDGHSNVNDNAKEAWAEDVNRFLTDTSRDQLAIDYGSTWPSYLVSFLVVLILTAWVRSRTRFIVDPAQGLFLIEERVFKTTYKDIPLARIDAAMIHEKVDDEGTKLEGVVLRLVDGAIKELSSYSNVERGDKEQLVAKLNEALDQAKGNEPWIFPHGTGS